MWTLTGMILILGITDYFYVALQLCLFAIIQYPIMDNHFAWNLGLY